MGLFNKNKKTEEELKEEALSENNIFEGVRCEVIFPDTQLKISTHSGLARGAATLAFGIIGLAAASSFKQEEKNRTIKTIFQVVEKGVVFKKATTEQKDLRIPYDNIVKVEMEKDIINIVLLENQDIKVKIMGVKSRVINATKYVREQIIDVLNERACGAQYEEDGWGLNHAPKQQIPEKEEATPIMDELERLGNMYEKGLLTDEEFKTMKEKLIYEK